MEKKKLQRLPLGSEWGYCLLFHLLILVSGYIATMFCAALTMLVTVKMHTPNLAVCIPFFLLCMMPFIARVLPAFDAFFDFAADCTD